MDYHDTKVLLHELEQLYLRDDDIKDMLDIRKMQREIEVQCELKLKDAKEIIKGNNCRSPLIDHCGAPC